MSARGPRRLWDDNSSDDEYAEPSPYEQFLAATRRDYFLGEAWRHALQWTPEERSVLLGLARMYRRRILLGWTQPPYSPDYTHTPPALRAQIIASMQATLATITGPAGTIPWEVRLDTVTHEDWRELCWCVTVLFFAAEEHHEVEDMLIDIGIMEIIDDAYSIGGVTSYEAGRYDSIADAEECLARLNRLVHSFADRVDRV